MLRVLAIVRPKSSGWISYSRMAPSLTRRPWWPRPGDLVHAVAAVDHQGVLGAQALQGPHLNTDQVGMEHAHQDVGRIGRVGQRAQDVEDRAHAQLAPHRATFFMAGWWLGANMKPMPVSAMHCAIASGVRLMAHPALPARRRCRSCC
jgi:hypothetical protein